MTTILSFDIGIFNLAFANVTVNPIIETTENKEKALNTVINDWGILCLKSHDDPKKMDLNVISRKLIELLNDKFGNVDFQTVLIENQPCMKNPTMKSIQMILYTFFVMHSYLEGRTIDIKFVSASNKLKVKHKTDVSHITTKSKYLQNKKFVVEYAKNYLELTRNINEKWIDLFNKEKKKDDWADAYCQAIHFIESL
jgi:hypothetical protein